MARPKKPSNEVRNYTIRFRVTQAEYEKFLAHKERHGCANDSEAARLLVRRLRG